MPIFDQGYQHWHGELAPRHLRWVSIARRGIEIQWKNRWTKSFVLMSWVPALALAGVLAIWGLIEQKSSFIMPWLSLLPELPADFESNPASYRRMVWTLAFFVFFTIEMTITMVLTSIVGPDLISKDLRFNAIPLYLSRPIRRYEYFLGKLGVIGGFIAATQIFPLILAYVLGLLFSLDFRVLRDTAPLFFGSMLYTTFVTFSAGTLMLAFSSLTRDSRWVGGVWVIFWVLSNGVSGALVQHFPDEQWPKVISYTYNLDRLRDQLIDVPSAWQKMADLAVSMSKMAQSATQPKSMFPWVKQPPPRRQRPPILGLGGGPGTPNLENQIRSALEYKGPPWTWSAGILAGLFGISAWILSFRVKSLDNLK